MTLADYQAKIAHLLFAPGPDTGGVIPTTGDYSAATITRDVNLNLDVFVALTNFTPGISEKLFTGPIVAGLDFLLPIDLVTISRIEYTAFGTQPLTMQPVSMIDWDALTGSGQATTQTGQPYYYREPYGSAGAMSIRLYPAPVAANVTQGDTITLYYTGLNTVLVNLTDVPGIPKPYHVAPAYMTLAEYWLRKKEPDTADRYQGKADRLIAAAKEYGFDRNMTNSYVEGDDSATDGWIDNIGVV